MGWEDAKGIKIVTKNFGVAQSHKLNVYQERGGWNAFKRALAMQPVAQTLGELSAFLGRPEAAARHFATAEQVARRWNSPHWAARARAAASLCPPNG